MAEDGEEPISDQEKVRSTSVYDCIHLQYNCTSEFHRVVYKKDLYNL